MTAQYGAHEVMELHEVLTNVVDGINQFELYRPYVTDQELSMMLDKQVQFMSQEYNQTVEALGQRGLVQPQPYQANLGSEPVYGLDNPMTQSPNTSAKRMNDRDVASGMLGFLKSASILKSMASLECADLNLRRMVQQGATNCSEMAYEIWQYMNHKGYYQVPTMKQMTTETMLNTYVPANIRNMETMTMQNMSGMQSPQPMTAMPQMQPMQIGNPAQYGSANVGNNMVAAVNQPDPTNFANNPGEGIFDQYNQSAGLGSNQGSFLQ